MSVSLQEIDAARERIAGKIVQTPIVLSASLSRGSRAPVYLKPEQRQTTGSFKIRGATNATALLSPAERKAGVVTVSSGNHARGLAHAAAAEGIRCVVCMSRLVPANKVEAVRALGAELRIIGKSQDEAQVEAERLASDEGLTMIPPFDHPAVIAGQGTIGLEILDELPAVELVLLPVSGGGLAAGIAAAVKARRPAVRVVGVSMARGAAMHASLEAGCPIAVEELPTLADALGGGIGTDNRYTFAMLRDLLDGLVLLTEAEIAAGVRHCWTEEGEVVEGAGAVGVGAILSGKVAVAGPTVVLLTGRNIAPDLHGRILRGEADTPDT